MTEKSTLTFTGDIGFDHFMAEKWTDPDLISADILNVMHASDHVIINVEGPLVGQDATLTQAAEMRLMHTIDPAATSVFSRLGADIWNLCNNHIMDAGPEGLQETLRVASEQGVKTLGVGMDVNQASEPVILDEAGGIGLFAVGYQRGCKPAGPDKAGCLNWSDFDIIQETIDKIRSQCKWCIIVSHGGEEFTSLPSPYTRDRYLRYLEMGADIVVCHHPHVPMSYELIRHDDKSHNQDSIVSDSASDEHMSDKSTAQANYTHEMSSDVLSKGDKGIFYSLGNFIFDTPYQRAQYNTEKGIVLSLSLDENSWEFKAYGIKIDRENEKVVSDKLPEIFENVNSEEYERLAPLSAKAFVEATKRQQIFLYPDKYKDADESVWEENFMNPKRSGRVPGEALDFQIICPFAETADEGAWKDSKLEGVKRYILEQM